MAAETFDEFDRRRLKELDEKVDLLVKMLAVTQDKVERQLGIKADKESVKYLRESNSSLRNKLAAARLANYKLKQELKLVQLETFKDMLKPLLDELSLQRNKERDEAAVRIDTRQTHSHVYQKRKK